MHNLNGISTTRDTIFREDAHIYLSIWSIQPLLCMHIFSLFAILLIVVFLCFIILLSFLQLFVCFNSTLNSNKVVKTIAPVSNKRPALKLMMQTRTVFSTFDSKIQSLTRINPEFRTPLQQRCLSQHETYKCNEQNKNIMQICYYLYYYSDCIVSSSSPPNANVGIFIIYILSVNSSPFEMSSHCLPIECANVEDSFALNISKQSSCVVRLSFI